MKILYNVYKFKHKTSIEVYLFISFFVGEV